jgi:two-component system response regulator NreC
VIAESGAADAHPIRVVLADDHPVVRRGLRSLLELEGGFDVVGEADDVPEAFEAVREAQPDVLVLDLNMPSGSSLDAISVLRTQHPETQIVILTMQHEPAYVRRALREGATGYVLKDAADQELVRAVRLAAAGELYLNPRMGARQAAHPDPGPAGALTEREIEVLSLVALGHTNGEIADRLCLSVRTVETHRAHIQRKLGTRSRSDLVRYALKQGLVGP